MIEKKNFMKIRQYIVLSNRAQKKTQDDVQEYLLNQMLCKAWYFFYFIQNLIYYGMYLLSLIELIFQTKKRKRILCVIEK